MKCYAERTLVFIGNKNICADPDNTHLEWQILSTGASKRSRQTIPDFSIKDNLFTHRSHRQDFADHSHCTQAHIPPHPTLPQPILENSSKAIGLRFKDEDWGQSFDSAWLGQLRNVMGFFHSCFFSRLEACNSRMMQLYTPKPLVAPGKDR